MDIILKELGIKHERIALKWVSAAEAPLFVEKITEFTSRIRDLGPLGEVEGLDREPLLRKIEAAKITMEGMKARMAFARQAKEINKDNSHGALPDAEKLVTTLAGEMRLYETLLCLKERKRTIEELADLLDHPVDLVHSSIETLKKKKMLKDDLTLCTSD